MTNPTGTDMEMARMHRIRQTLSNCQEKLALYRAQHSGEYIGGVEYMVLMQRVAGAIVDVIDLETALSPTVDASPELTKGNL